MPEWSFLTSHARVLLRIGHDPGLRLRDRNHYQIQAHLPLPEPGTREASIGELLAVLLADTPGIAGPAALR
jgi:hypothetical protein